MASKVRGSLKKRAALFRIWCATDTVPLNDPVISLQVYQHIMYIMLSKWNHESASNTRINWCPGECRNIHRALGELAFIKFLGHKVRVANVVLCFILAIPP